jgi:hypothetical protein
MLPQAKEWATMPEWLCEPEDAVNGPWTVDAPWTAATDRHGFSYYVLSKFRVERAYQAMQFVAGADLERQLFYGNGYAHPGEMTGFASFYNTRDPNEVQNAVCVFDGDGRGDVTSMWLIGWGPRTAYMVTPDGLPPVHGGEIALVIGDWRYCYRAANIPVDSSAADLEALLIQMKMSLPRPANKDTLRPVFYMNEKQRAKLDTHIYKSIPIRAMAIAENEAVLA